MKRHPSTNASLLIASMVIVLVGVASPSTPAVKLFDGRLEIDGVTLLQDSDDPYAYYYVPPYPILAREADGAYALSFIRYTGGEDEGGGLFNATVQFALPPERVEALGRRLEAERGGRLVGAVSFTDPEDDLEEGVAKDAAFRVVSATLGQPGTSLVTSGSAPVGPGGRAVIAARLDAANAALLWASFQEGATTDVAFEVDAAYLARIEAFNAVVEAEMETVYEHFSRLENEQGGFERDQVQQIVDDLSQEQIIRITSTDAGAAFNVSSGKWEKMVEVITEKLVEVMFDTEAGWAKPIDREDPNFDIKGRVPGGTISGSFLGLGFFNSGEIGYRENTDYVPDDQYVLKRRTDIRTNRFRMDLTRSQVIRAPYKTTGNIGSLFARLSGDARYFRVIDLDDEARQTSLVKFTVDGGYADAFEDIIDSVSVDVRHESEGNVRSYPRRLSAAELTEGATLAFDDIVLKRLGAASPDWSRYRYRVQWNFRGRPEPVVDPEGGGWLTTDSATPRLAPPLTRSEITVLIDAEAFSDDDVRAVTVDLMSEFLGKKEILKTLHSARDDESDPMREVVLFHDSGAPIVARVTYIRRSGARAEPPRYAENNGTVYVGLPSGSEPE